MTTLAQARVEYPSCFQVTAAFPPHGLVPGDFFWYARRNAVLPLAEILAPDPESGVMRQITVPCEFGEFRDSPETAAQAAADRETWETFFTAQILDHTPKGPHAA